MNFYEKLQSSNKVYFIAEAADAHYGSIQRAFEMVDNAYKSGANAIKFQHHLPDEEMLRDIPLSKNMREPLYDFLTKNALSLDQHRLVFDYCKKVGIEYLCTPFSWRAAIELEENFDLPVYKIGSGEMTDLPTLEKIALFGKPMIVSTGMSAVAEITNTYNFLTSRMVPLILMNCTSAYPPRYQDLHLGFIKVMKEIYPKAIIGHSDHTNSTLSSLVAVAYGAKLIEKHITIDTELKGPDAEVSLTFKDLKNLIEDSNNILEAISEVKEIHETEKEIVAWARRSLVYMKPLTKGSIIGPDDIWGKRPGTGVPSLQYWEILGKKLNCDVEKNTLLKLSDFEDQI